MSERKVLSKYYPPDFDPSKLDRRSKKGKDKDNPKNKLAPVRLMAPFPMKCTACGEYIYKGRKFNARKEVTENKYLTISIIRLYIRCTRCSAEITFLTDPKNTDYTCERGAMRITEPWRMNGGGLQESDEERLDRLEREEEEKNAMQELETKTMDAKREMAVADALDEIRTRNARNELLGKDGVEVTVARESINEEKKRQEMEDEQAARTAFIRVHEAFEEVIEDGEEYTYMDGDTNKAIPAITNEQALEMPPPSFKRVVKKRKANSALLGIKKKPALVVDYDSD
ncbi:CWC16 protein [Calycina marina]|uniref:Splicing factor YJU2 n=1 Tax=Calycina marina TaxID=1763456 RepID=A0A9P8CAU0_9HELO|nr:CWC16 protein [Calycina marina]